MGNDNVDVAVNERPTLHGHMILSTHTMRPEWEGMDPHHLLRLLEVADADQVVDADNIMCVNGLSQLIQSVLWSSIADQNTNMGQPYTASYMYPIYGAVGTGTTAVTSNDTQLTTEAARAICASAGVTNASVSTDPEVVWSFLFGAPGSALTIAEAGVFLCATSTTNNGLLLDHALITPTVAQSTSQLLTLTVVITMGN